MEVNLVTIAENSSITVLPHSTKPNEIGGRGGEEKPYKYLKVVGIGQSRGSCQGAP